MNLDCEVLKLVPTPGLNENSFPLCQRFDLYSLEILKNRKFREFSSCGTYKRVADKVRTVDRSESDGTMPGGTATWKVDVMKMEKYLKDPGARYVDWLIPKFSLNDKGSRLTSARLREMRAGSKLTSQERDVLTELLHNREATLSWAFDEMCSVIPSVASLTGWGAVLG